MGEKNRITINKNSIHKLIAMVLCFVLFASCAMSSFAAIGSAEAEITVSEQFELDGKQYILVRQFCRDKVVATVYNSSNMVISSFTNELTFGALDGRFIENVNAVQWYAASTDYKLVSTTTGSFKPAAWTTVAVIVAIAAMNPGAGSAAIAALASAIITDAGASYTYKMETWTKSDRTYFYQKTVFKIYNKETGKKVDPDLVTSTKTRQK
ncbi:hypothetical protein ACPW7J_08345 [Ihubacter sp. rT4E-8]|uniref:hypothetical protein n=1 Tax=Ihubacter sp. rT4E-8 TaxID=3242369 RepID=UPI003CF862DA